MVEKMGGRTANLEKKILETIPNVLVNGDSKHRLPNTVSVSFEYIEGDTLLGIGGDDDQTCVGLPFMEPLAKSCNWLIDMEARTCSAMGNEAPCSAAAMRRCCALLLAGIVYRLSLIRGHRVRARSSSGQRL